MKLLARREHSQRELMVKLERQGFKREAIENALEELQMKGLQSDARFAESYMQSRMARGFGPRRIAAELRERGVDSEGAETALWSGNADWTEVAREAWRKKFRQGAGRSTAERARQIRYLEYRGFTHEQIRAVLDRSDPEDS